MKQKLPGIVFVMLITFVLGATLLGGRWSDNVQSNIIGTDSAKSRTEQFNRCPYNFPSGTLEDDENDQAIAQNDITSVTAKQISKNALQLKISVRGNPLDIRESHYLIFVDSDNNTETGRYHEQWDMGEDFAVRIGYDEYQQKYFAVIESPTEGFIVDIPVSMYEHSAYVVIPLTAYKSSYQFADNMKFAIDVVNVPDANDFVPNTAQLHVQPDFMGPRSTITSANTIFSQSPHSIYLDYNQRNNPVTLSTRSDIPTNGIRYFSTHSTIAELSNGNELRTNFDIINDTFNADYSWITAYLPLCDVMTEDSIMALSGTDLYLSGNVAFLMPPYSRNQYDGSLIDFEQLLTQHTVALISDYAYAIEKELTGANPTNGDNRIFAFNYPACGWAGQPMWFGWGCVLQPHIDNESRPAWEIYYHELGHVMLEYIFSHKFSGLTADNNMSYMEGWATLNGMYTIHKLIQNRDNYPMSDDTFSTLEYTFDSYYGYVNSTACSDNPPETCNRSLWAYEHVFNYDFSELDANIIDGMFISIAEDTQINPRGWEIYPRFYQAFSPKYWSAYADVDDAIKANTFFIAAMSAAAGNDLSDVFVEKWNFPFDELYFNEIYPLLTSLIDYPSLELLAPTIDGMSVEQNGVAFASCEEFDVTWCKTVNPTAQGKGPFEVKWGDRNVSCSWFPSAHTYSYPGKYTISVRAKNTCGFISEKQNQISL